MPSYYSQIDVELWRHHAWRNRVQSFLLLFLMLSFLTLLGWLFWGSTGLWIVLIVVTASVIINPSLSPWWIMRMYGASRITPQHSPSLWHILQQLSQRAGLPTAPNLYYLPSHVLNAFAVGSPHNSAIAITDGILRKLELREMAGILAHEISHIRNNDIWVMGLADIFSRLTSALSVFGQILLFISLPLILFTDLSINWVALILLIIAPSISALAQLALSRTREYDADLNAARLTGDTDGLASALLKIENYQGGWMERIFLPGRRSPQPSLLRSHPDTQNRVDRLMQIKSSHEPQQWLLQVPNDLSSMLMRQKLPRPRWRMNGLWY